MKYCHKHIRLLFLNSIVMSILFLFPKVIHSDVLEGLKIYSGADQKNMINDIFCDGSDLWCATDGGLVKWNTLNDSYEVITVSHNGLGAVPTYCIDRDDDGVFWIGTGHGVSSFDGSKWETYRDIDASHDDGRASVRQIAIKGNEIWMGMYYYGLTLYDGVTWTTYGIQNVDHPLPRMHTVYTLVYDQEGKLWAGFEQGHTNAHYGLAAYANQEWKTYSMYDSGLPGYRVKAAAVDSNNVKWFATIRYDDRGIDALCSFDGINWTVFTTEDGLPNDDITVLAVDKENNIWIGTTSGLIRFNGIEWTTYLDQEHILSLTVDDSNRLWVGTAKGLLRLDDDKFIPYLVDDGPKHGGGKSCVLDKSGGIWYEAINTYYPFTGLGLVHFDGSQWSHLSEDDGLISNKINDLAVDDENNLWIATDAGLCRYNGSFKNFSSTKVNSVAIENGSIIWYGTDNGAYSIGGSSYRPDNKTVVKGIAIDEQTNTKWFIIGYYDDSLFTMYHELGVAKFDGTNVTYYGYPNYGYPDKNGLCDIRVEDIEIDHEGKVWCVCDGGLTIFDGETTTIIEDDIYRYFNGSYWTTEPISPHWSIRSGQTLAFSPDNTAWLGSRHDYGGLTNNHDPNWLYIDMEHGIPRSAIFDIVISQDGTLWFTTRYGLCSYQEDITPSSIHEEVAQPINIITNHPNPFNPSTTISFTLSEAGNTNISIYNISGQKVRELLDSHLPAGSNSILWDGRDDTGSRVSTGIYFAQLVSGEKTGVRKMLLMK